MALLAAEPLATNEQVFWLPPLSYEQVYKVFENLHLGPYLAFKPQTWLNLIYTHRLWILLLSSLFLALVLHNLRVSYLVKTTSAKLKKAMQKQQHQQQEINHLSKFALMGEVTAGLAHELNQPLTSIVNYAQGSSQLLVSKQLNSTQLAALEQAAQKTVQQAEQAAAIIKNFRNFLRKTSNTSELLEANQVAQEAAELIETRVSWANAKLTLNLVKQQVKFTANKVEVLQILLNLLTNALDALQNSEVKKVTLSVEITDSKLIFKVEDTGEGIAAAAKNKVFNPFYTSRAKGMGLGLNLSQKLAETYNAQIKLTNLASGGCLASLEWPYAPDQPFK